MPTYDYRCEANGQVLEVKHRMNEPVSTWGELCAMSGEMLGETPADSPVQRLATGGQVVKSSNLGSEAAPCGMGSRCGGGACGLN